MTPEDYNFSSSTARVKQRMRLKSSSNLPASEGYRVAKETLCENFGKSHVIAGAKYRSY